MEVHSLLVEYSSNNSGGQWWLSDKDWKRLEKAGWKVEWYRDNPPFGDTASLHKGRFLGALASRATREAKSLQEAIEEWEEITGQDPNDEGCSCCGNPHNFWAMDDDDA